MPIRPREVFGFGKRPLSGTENPMLNQSQAQRFEQAGLAPFLPYIDPWQTLAREQDYRAVNRDLELADTEDRFFQAIQQDPKTGWQRFLAENPMASVSPMIRSYALTQQRMNQPQEDPFVKEAAEGGTEALSEYLKNPGPAGFAAAQDVIRKRKAAEEAAGRKPSDERLSLTGQPREEFDRLAKTLAQARERASRNPSDEEKQAFLQQTGGDWNKAFNLAVEKAKAEEAAAMDSLRKFQSSYGSMYQMPPLGEPAPVSPQPVNVPQVLPKQVEPEQIPPAKESTVIPEERSTIPEPSADLPKVVATPYADDLEKVRKSIPSAKGMEKIQLLQKEKELTAAAAREKERHEQEKVVKKEDEAIKENQESLASSIEQIMSKVEDFEDFATGIRMPTTMLRKLGFDPKEVAFTTKDGRKITWNEVGYKMYQDPKVMELLTGPRRDPVTASTAPIPPRKVTVIREIK